MDKSITTNISETLAERGKRYGDFIGHGIIAQQIKDVMRGFSPGTSMGTAWENLLPFQREAL